MNRTSIAQPTERAPTTVYRLNPNTRYVQNKLDSSGYDGQVVYRRPVVGDTGVAEAPTRSAGASATQGLSKVHNGPQPDRWRFRSYQDGSLCELKGLNCGGHVAIPPAKRGKVRSFSAASRRRMLKTVGRLRQDALPHFITLTYPDEFPFDAQTWRNHLAAMWRRIRRRWPGPSALWKKEFKRRRTGANMGKVAPHFHMLLWGAEIKQDDPYDWVKHWKLQFARCNLADGMKLICTEHYLDGLEPELKDLGPDVKVYQQVRVRKRGKQTTVRYYRQDSIPHLTNQAKETAKTCAGIPAERDTLEELRAWFSATWAEIVGSDDPRHLTAGTRVEAVKSVRGVFAYASKYLAKREDDPAQEYESIGRCWGILGREHLPWATEVEMELEWEQGIQLRRVATRYLTAERRKRGVGGRYKCRLGGMFWFSSGPPAWERVARRPVEPF